MTKTDPTAANNFHAYMRGWRHGATGRAKDPNLIEHKTLGETYRRGYSDGLEDHSTVVQGAAARYGYTPSVLRGRAA